MSSVWKVDEEEEVGEANDQCFIDQAGSLSKRHDSTRREPTDQSKRTHGPKRSCLLARDAWTSSVSAIQVYLDKQVETCTSCNSPLSSFESDRGHFARVFSFSCVALSGLGFDRRRDKR